MRRRELLKGTSIVAGAIVLTHAPSVNCLAKSDEPKQDVTKRKKALFVGAHPDDPETGCGGTIALCSDVGYDAVIVYLTRGEAGIRRKSHNEAATIRTAEADEACRILKARPVFVGQIDGDSEVNPKRYDYFREIVENESPDALFTHWPIDTHRDHRATSLLAYDAWTKLKRPFELFYYEVMTGSQTQMFTPNCYVDIGKTEPRKRLASMAHSSQNMVKDYEHHDLMNRARGIESGCTFAEAFMRHFQSPGDRFLDELKRDAERNAQ